MPQATGRPTISPPLSLFIPSPPAPSVLARHCNGVPSKNLLPRTTQVASGVRCVHIAWPPSPVDHGPEHLNGPANAHCQARSVMTFAPYMGDVTLGQGAFGAWHALRSISMVDSVACMRYAERSRAPDCVADGYGSPMQTAGCTWP